MRFPNVSLLTVSLGQKMGMDVKPHSGKNINWVEISFFGRKIIGSKTKKKLKD